LAVEKIRQIWMACYAMPRAAEPAAGRIMLA
jgi:hypothetical protein